MFSNSLVHLPTPQIPQRLILTCFQKLTAFLISHSVVHNFSLNVVPISSLFSQLPQQIHLLHRLIEPPQINECPSLFTMR